MLTLENNVQTDVDEFLDTMEEIFNDPEFTSNDKTAILESTYEFIMEEGRHC
ncbi:MAG: hypothetical protein H8D97_01090 [Proteobacteria bacterium]|nr:hypothetical protein [Pseudomonadota bacterium]